MITTSQKFQIGGVIVSALSGASALLGLYGLSSNQAAAIVGTVALFGVIWNGIGTIVTGQAAAVREVAAMPGVSKITTNANASEALRSVSADPNQPKVE